MHEPAEADVVPRLYRVAVDPVRVPRNSWQRGEGGTPGPAAAPAPADSGPVPEATRAELARVLGGGTVQAGPNRFDDSQARFLVRYAASTVAVCLIEKLAYLSSSPASAEVLAGIIVDDDDSDGSEVDRVAGVQEVLAPQRVMSFRLASPARLGDVGDAVLLRAMEAESLDLRSRLLDVSAALHLGEPKLDAGMMLLSGDVGRRLTQAVARAVHDQDERTVGILYRSRHDLDESNIALFADRADLLDVEVTALSSADPAHRSAVRRALQHHGLPLPAEWQ